MPAFKYRQKNSLIVFERGHKAHGYVQTAECFLLGNRPARRGYIVMPLRGWEPNSAYSGLGA